MSLSHNRNPNSLRTLFRLAYKTIPHDIYVLSSSLKQLEIKLSKHDSRREVEFGVGETAIGLDQIAALKEERCQSLLDTNTDPAPSAKRHKILFKPRALLLGFDPSRGVELLGRGEDAGVVVDKVVGHTYWYLHPSYQLNDDNNGQC